MRGYVDHVYCTYCAVWLPKKFDRCPDCNKRTRKNTRNNMGDRKGVVRIEV